MPYYFIDNPIDLSNEQALSNPKNVSIKISDLIKNKAFYEKAFSPLGYKISFGKANPADMRFFTNEMKVAEPEKFKIVWEELSDNYKQLISRYAKGCLAHA